MVQEVNEVVQPFRVLKQEVKPVIEAAHTVVAQGENIPLSGRTSGIIATQAAVRPALAQHAVALDTSRLVLDRPEVNRLELVQPEIAAINVAQPVVERVAFNQPTVARVALNEPELTRVAFTGPRIAHISQPLHIARSDIGSRIGSLGLGLGNSVGFAHANRVSSIGVQSPLLRNLDIRRQNLGLINSGVSNLETSKLILSQPPAVKSRIIRY